MMTSLGGFSAGGGGGQLVTSGGGAGSSRRVHFFRLGKPRVFFVPLLPAFPHAGRPPSPRPPGFKLSPHHHNIQRESKKIPLRFSDIFSKRLGICSPNFTCLLYVRIYAGLQIFIQLTATLTKLCHHNIKRDHHHMLKMSTIGRNARWVVALNVA